MTSGFSDPNNHVPELSPDDDWGDAEAHVAEIPQVTAVLPPRRIVTEIVEDGLRISPNVARDESPETPRRIEVQQINADVVRLEQEEPAPPRVDRVVAFHEKPERTEEEKRPQGERRDWGVAHSGSSKWIYAMGAGVAICVVLGIIALPKINAPNTPRSLPGDGAPAFVREQPPEGIDELNKLLTRQPEAIQIFRAFSQAAHPDEVGPLIRHSDALKETLRQHWKPMQISSQWQVPADAGWIVQELEGHPTALLDVVLPDFSPFRAYFVVESDQLLLDWKASTAFSTATFAELKSGEGDGSEIRGELSVATFYTSVFTEAHYQNLRLTAPDGETAIWCYAPNDSKARAVIAEKFQVGTIIQDQDQAKSAKITLHLVRGPQDALSNQWLIKDVLHLDWVSP